MSSRTQILLQTQVLSLVKTENWQYLQACPTWLNANGAILLGTVLAYLYGEREANLTNGRSTVVVLYK